MKLLNKVKISLLISLFIIILFHIKAFAVEGTVTEITVNVREKASTDSKKVMYVTQDDKVEVLEKVGDWYKIEVNNKTGYVFGKYIKVDDSKLASTEKTNSEQTENQTIKNEEENKDITTDAPNKLIVKNKTQIRIVPTISSSVIYTASKDTEIKIIEQTNNWTYVSIENILGWVRTDNIIEENGITSSEKSTNESNDTSTTTSKEEETTTKTKVAYIKYDTVNLREKASTSSKSLAKLKLNDEVTVLEEVDSVWSKVEADGKTGYISTDLLADKKQEEKKTEAIKDNNTTSRDGETTSREDTTNITTKKDEETATKKEVTTTTTKNTGNTASKKEETTYSKATGADIVAYAKKYLGYKYVYGGASPSTGFDCSGFTCYVYKHFGYTLSRSSVSQATNGKEVEKSDLQPGDLVFYKNTSLTRIGHVGIYIGDNKMIHASEPGVGVIITDIDSASHNYPKRYVTSRRII